MIGMCWRSVCDTVKANLCGWRRMDIPESGLKKVYLSSSSCPKSKSCFITAGIFPECTRPAYHKVIKLRLAGKKIKVPSQSCRLLKSLFFLSLTQTKFINLYKCIVLNIFYTGVRKSFNVTFYSNAQL